MALEHRAAVNAVLLVAVTLCCVVTSYFLRRSQRIKYYLPESAASMTIGVIAGSIASLVVDQDTRKALRFQPEVFFFLLLPPIVFDAGFSIKKRLFFDNIGSILLFAVFGTIISTFTVGLLTFGAAKIGAIAIDASTPFQSLVFGALISSVDPVATLSIMGDPSVGVDPLLYSLVFGESVLNDAVAIVLFRSFLTEDATDALDKTFTFDQIGSVMTRFFLVALGSLILGSCIGLFCSFAFKNATRLREHPVMEVQLLFLTAFGSFALGELLNLSGVTSLFCTGLTLSHYNFYNLSDESKISSLYVFETMAKTAETLIFVSIGLSLFATTMEWDVGFIVLAWIFCILARALNIFPLAMLSNLCRERKISKNAMFIMFFSGLRGSVSFALAMQLDSNAPGVGVVQSTTLMLIILTTLSLGGSAYKVIDTLGMRANQSGNGGAGGQSSSIHEINELREDFSSYMEMNGGNGVNRGGGDSRETGTLRRPVTKFWERLDHLYMRPMFGGSTETNARRARRAAAATESDPDESVTEGLWQNRIDRILEDEAAGEGEIKTSMLSAMSSSGGGILSEESNHVTATTMVPSGKRTSTIGLSKSTSAPR